MTTIETTYYQQAFGRKPKSSDYALWIFNLGRQGAWTEFTWNGTYATAAKLAKPKQNDSAVPRSALHNSHSPARCKAGLTRRIPMKTKLTDLQKVYLQSLINDGPQALGSHVPQVKRTFDALVAKGGTQYAPR